MSNTERQDDRDHAKVMLYRGGILLIATSVLSIVFMAMHPTSGAHDMQDFADRAAKGFRGNGVVHGVLIALSFLLSVAMLMLGDLLGRDRLIVRLAGGATLVGTIGAVLAGLINGFILPGTAAYFADDAADGFATVFRLCQVSNGTFARTCVIGWSVAAVLWGSAMIGRGGVQRVAGPIGVLFGLTPLLMLMYGHLPMNIPGFGMFVVLHGVWGIAAGVSLVWHHQAEA